MNSDLNNTARNTNDVAKLRRLVNQGADLTSTNGSPWHHTPMHQACYHNRPEMVRELIVLCKEKGVFDRVMRMSSNPCGRGGSGTPRDLARPHRRVLHVLDSAGGPLSSPEMSAIERGEPPEYIPGVYEENYGLVLLPMYGHPDFDKGAYNTPYGCCVTLRRNEVDRSCGDNFCETCWCCPLTFALYIGTLAWQPCGICCAGHCPWLGDCPFTNHRVTHHYVEKYPNLLSSGPAYDRYILSTLTTEDLLQRVGGPQLQVTVRTLRGKAHRITTSEKVTVAFLKRQACEAEGLERGSNINLMLNNKALGSDDNKKLKGLVDNGCELHLVVNSTSNL